MKYLVAAVVLCILLTGCNAGQRTNKGPEFTDSDRPALEQKVPPAPQSQEMPGGVGVTAGQSGTGVTTGGSTGY